jgi:transmembrane sensor
MEKTIFLKLIDNYLDGTASPAERAVLEEYYERLEASGNTELSTEQEEALKAAMYAKIRSRMETTTTAPVISMRRRLFVRIAAVAASILLLASVYWLFIDNPKQQENVVAQQDKTSPIDILPGKDAAILTFDNGKQVILDSAAGTISKEDGATIVNANGTVTYSTTNENEIAWHTISTARGNQYQLVLADGSKVYLNSASSLRFPSSFKGSTREVELTGGEAYFNIATNEAMPFHVKTREMTVKVTGTHFNVNAYNDEGPVTTTLIEGKVSVNQNAQAINIKPGEQAVFSNNKFLIIQPDINKVIAWRTGFFDFDNMDITAIMRQVSRWYDVDVVYEGKITTDKFGGRISRLLPLSQVLKLLEENDVKFNLEGKRLMVK